MQIGKVEFGKCYAIRVSGDEGFRSFRVSKIVSEKTQGNTVNYVIGNFETGPNAGKPEAIKYEVSRLEGPVEEYAALVAEKRKRDEEAKAKAKEDQCIANEAGKLLGNKLGVKYGPEYNMPIRVSHAEITIHANAMPALIAFLKA